ncbi:SDR family NAD(P)-dependent oxidoreductase [Actinoplanes sp. NBC_00393]
MDTGLQQRVVLVTGGSAGIGAATAVAFAREGAKVAITYRKDERSAAAVVAAITEAGGEGRDPTAPPSPACTAWPAAWPGRAAATASWSTSSHPASPSPSGARTSRSRSSTGSPRAHRRAACRRRTTSPSWSCSSVPAPTAT